MVSENEDIEHLESFAAIDEPEPDTVESDIVDVGENGPELPAPEAELMTVDEFRDVLRFGFDFPQTLAPMWGPLAIQGNEESGFEAFGQALYNLLDRSDFTRKVLRRSNSLVGDLIAVGSFGYMKLVTVKMILVAQKQVKEPELPPDAPKEPVSQFEGLREPDSEAA